MEKKNKDIKQELKKEIKSREKLEELINNHIFNYNAQIEKLNKDISKVAGQGKKIEELPEWINEAKKEITTFTFELIAIIVGFLSLLLAIIVLTVNQGKINSELVYIYAILGVFSLILFGFFIYYFRKKHFPKIKGADVENIISYINSKNSEMVGVINTTNSNIRKYIDGKISEVAKLVKGEKK